MRFSRSAPRQRPTALALLLVTALAACDLRAPADSHDANGTSRVVAVDPEDGAARAEATEWLVDGRWVRHGAFRAWHADGSLAARGEYRAGARTGPWTEFHPGGALAAMGAYLFDQREGVWVVRAADGSLDAEATGVYEAGERVSAWYPEGVRGGVLNNGLRQEATYVDGLREGPARGYYPDGTPESAGAYRAGLRDGPWRFWTPTGALDRVQSGVYREHVKIAELDAAADAGSEGAQE